MSRRVRGDRVVHGWMAVVVLAATLLAVGQASATPAGAAPLDGGAVTSLDGPIQSSEVVGDPAGVTVLSVPQGSFNGFPTQGDSALILSTGDATVVADPAKGALESVVGTDQIGTDLAGGGSADGNDLTQVRLNLAPPQDATCVAFDFLFLSEEYPNYVGQDFNDIFTAEIDQTSFALNGNQVSAPNNFAYGENEELLSVNTFTSFTDAQGSTLNGKSPTLSAVAPLRSYTEEGYPLFLTVQDLGDSDIDTAVVIDNLRYSSGTSCDPTVVSIVDSDGDSLSDVWETKGIDYDGDGTPELDLPAMGADPQRKDIFIEVDWMFEAPTCATSGTVSTCPANPKDMTPNAKAIAAVVTAFADAPVSNPDGSTGIDLHVDAGRDYPMDGTKTWGDKSQAGSLAYAQSLGSYDANFNYDWGPFDQIKAANFEVERGDAFHYIVYADRLGACDPNSTDNNCSSGISRGIPGGDQIVADSWGGFTLQQEAGTFMHELGHNLGLTHAANGSGDPRYQQGYRSVMNYCYQMPGLGETDDQVSISGLDYSRGAAGRVKVPCAREANGAAQSEIDAITYSDWDNIKFDGGSVGDLGDSAPPPAETEIETFTKDEAERLSIAASPGDGAVDFVGPDLFAAGVDGQVVLVDVTNPSAEEATYRVEVADPFGGEPVEVTVPPGETQRVEAPVDMGKLIDEATPLTVSLFNGDVLVAESAQDITAVDLGDEKVAADAEALLAQIADDPPEGYDPEVATQLDSSLQPVLAGEVVPDIESDDDGPPLGLIAGIGAGILVLVIAVVLVLRSRRTG